MAQRQNSGHPGGKACNISLAIDISERLRLEKENRRMAFRDPLTQLPNRRLLHDRLDRLLRRLRREGGYGSMLFLDLDNFKPLNDRHGHALGDLLLQEVARRLHSWSGKVTPWDVLVATNSSSSSMDSTGIQKPPASRPSVSHTKC